MSNQQEILTKKHEELKEKAKSSAIAAKYTNQLLSSVQKQTSAASGLVSEEKLKQEAIIGPWKESTELVHVTTTECPFEEEEIFTAHTKEADFGNDDIARIEFKKRKVKSRSLKK